MACAAYVILLSFDISIIDYLEILSIYTTSILLGAVTFIPAGIGVTEGSLAGFFTLQGIDISLALTIVVFIRIFTRWIGVGLGFLLLKLTGGLSTENESTK